MAPSQWSPGGGRLRLISPMSVVNEPEAERQCEQIEEGVVAGQEDEDLE